MLVAALTGPRPVSPEGVRLLATVFQWTQWRDLFERSTFRTGTVWEVQQHRPTASPPGSRVFRHVPGRGRQRAATPSGDHHRPGPAAASEIVAFDGRDRYRARLIQEPVWGPRR